MRSCRDLLLHAIIALCALLVCIPTSVLAQARLSDALSPRQRVNATLEWAEKFPGRNTPSDRLHALVAKVPDVELKLDTSHAQGRRARVFLVLPLDIGGVRSPNGVRLEWRGRGRFFDGSAVPGQRTLLFEGKIDGPDLHGFLDMTLHLDARSVQLPISCEPTYEIELL